MLIITDKFSPKNLTCPYLVQPFDETKLLAVVKESVATGDTVVICGFNPGEHNVWERFVPEGGWDAITITSEKLQCRWYDLPTLRDTAEDTVWVLGPNNDPANVMKVTMSRTLEGLIQNFTF